MKHFGIRCPQCKQMVWSKRGGDWQQCTCGETYIDRDRWDDQMIRLGGNNLNLANIQEKEVDDGKETIN